MLTALALSGRALGAQQTDSARAGVAATVRAATRDTVGPPISPRAAFLRSLLIPGWGQGALDRGQIGAVFAVTEFVSIAMAVKSARELREARLFNGDSIIIGYRPPDAQGAVIRNPITGELEAAICPRGSPFVDEAYADSTGGAAPIRCETRYNAELVRARRTHVEDWIALLLFNHLFAAADAFVAAHLWDLPARVSVRPSGDGVAVLARVAW